MIVASDSRWMWDAQNTADASYRAALDPVVSRDRRLSQVGGIHPHVVFRAMMVKEAAVVAQLPFELPTIHGALIRE